MGPYFSCGLRLVSVGAVCQFGIRRRFGRLWYQNEGRHYHSACSVSCYGKRPTCCYSFHNRSPLARLRSEACRGRRGCMGLEWRTSKNSQNNDRSNSNQNQAWQTKGRSPGKNRTWQRRDYLSQGKEHFTPKWSEAANKPNPVTLIKDEGTLRTRHRDPSRAEKHYCRTVLKSTHAHSSKLH